jgi:tocopherol O-methyltransferase
MTDREIRQLALNKAIESREFMLSLPRLILALRGGAMRYGVFVWERP